MVKWKWEEKDSKRTWLIEKCMGMKEYKYWKKKEIRAGHPGKTCFSDLKAATNATSHEFAFSTPRVLRRLSSSCCCRGGWQIYVDRLQTLRIQAAASDPTSREALLIRPLLSKGSHRTGSHPLRQAEDDNTRPTNNMADMMLPLHWYRKDFIPCYHHKHRLVTHCFATSFMWRHTKIYHGASYIFI